MFALVLLFIYSNLCRPLRGAKRLKWNFLGGNKGFVHLKTTRLEPLETCVHVTGSSKTCC